MRITVGTANQVKVSAVAELLKQYQPLAEAEVVGVEVDSGVRDQPLSLEEIVEGAKNRARNAFSEDYSVGLEAGFMEVPGSQSGSMNVCAAVVYDGTAFHLGLSSAFETPDAEIMRLVREEGMTLAQATNHTGLVDDPAIGKGAGVVGMITKGRVNRKEYIQEAMRMALVHIDT